MQVGLIMNNPDTPIGNLFLVLASIVGKENQVIHLQNVLTLLFEPRSAREEFLVEELALARQELAELGQRREALLAAQRETAARQYEMEAAMAQVSVGGSAPYGQRASWRAKHGRDMACDGPTT